MISKSERGRRGGRARAASMNAQQRKDIARKAANTRWSKAVTDNNEVVLHVTVELSNGHFKSSISVPLFADEHLRESFVESWLMMIEAGIKAGRSSRENQSPIRVTEQQVVDAFHMSGLGTCMSAKDLTEALNTILGMKNEVKS